MIKPIFELNGREINPPNNWEELSIELSFDQDNPSFAGQVAITQWDIGLGAKNDPRDGAKLIEGFINGGLTGGIGVFEGMPFDIKLKDGSTIHDLFQGFLDISEAEVTCSKVIAQATETGKIDWLNNVADSFTFEYLYHDDGLPPSKLNLDIGERKLSSTDFIKIPYIISSIPNTQELFTLTISIFVITQELIDTYQDWQTVSLPFTSDYLEFGNLIALISLTIKNILLIIALIKLIDQILDVLIQPIKYHSAMLVRDLCDFGSKRLGFSKFESSIFDGSDGKGFENLIILPETYRQFNNDRGDRRVLGKLKDSLLGSFDQRADNTVGYFKGTFGDLLRELKLLFNAKIVIDGDTLRLEHVDYKLSGNQWRIPDTDKTNVPFRFNHEDFAAHYNLTFTPDLNDKNVWQNYIGTEVHVITSPVRTNVYRNLLMKGEKIVQSKFSLGRRKTSLTFAERRVRDFVVSTDRIIGTSQKIINKFIQLAQNVLNPVSRLINTLNSLPSVNIPFNPPIPPPIDFKWRLSDVLNMNKRLGSLLLENDFVNLPKMLLIQAQDKKNPYRGRVQIHPDNNEKVSALYIYDNYHSTTSFVGSNPNQYKIYSITGVEFCIDDYNLVKNNSFIKDSDGITDAEIVSVKWNIFKQEADITYRVREKYTSNLEQTIVVSDGR